MREATIGSMRPAMDSLLAKVSPAEIAAAPFPHITLDRAMDTAIYQRFARDVPGFERVGCAGEPPDNGRYCYAAWQILRDQTLDPLWHAFVRLHSSAGFFHQVLTLFDGHWAALNPRFADFLSAIADLRCGRLGIDNFDRADVLLDARLEINTPVKSRPSSVRWAHVDTPNRIYSGLFYLRAPEDGSLGGDLQLFRWADGVPKALDRFELPADQVESVTTIAYAANRLVLFPNSAHAIHGVTPRAVTPHQRAYMFVTAELEHDLFGEWV